MKPHPVAIIVANTFSIEIGTLLRVFRTTQAISEHTEKIMELEAIYENVQDKNRNTVGPQTQSQNRIESQNRSKRKKLIFELSSCCI